MKNIIVRQNDIKDCGICSLESIIKFYGGYVPLEDLRMETKTGKNGTSAFNLINVAKKLGFDAMGKKIDDLEISNDILPVIAHMELKNGLNHFVVVYKITKDKVYLMDPARGYVKVKRDEFLSEWTNVILIFKPVTKIALYEESNIMKEFVLIFLQKEKKLLLMLFCLSIVVTLLSVLLGYYFKIMIDLVSSSSFGMVLFVICLFIMISIYKVYFSFLRTDLCIYLNKDIDVNVIPSFIKHVFNLPLNVIKSRTSGEILTRVNELNAVKSLFSEVIVTLMINFSLCVGTGIFLYFISDKLFFLLCLMIIIYVVIVLLMMPIIQRKINDNIDLQTDFNSELVEKVDSIESIKNLNCKNFIVDKISDKYGRYLNDSFKYAKFLNIYNLVKMVFNDIGLLLLSSYGVFSIFKGNMSLLSLITFNSLVAYFAEPIFGMVELIPQYFLIKVSLTKVKNFLAIKEEKEGKLETFHNGEIEFCDISYSYDDYNYTLNKISRKIGNGKHITIRGKSGSGKSTLCKILCRNIGDFKGQIKIGGINILDYSLMTIRNNIVYVSQREKIFNGSIRDNILLDSDAKMEELNKVLEITRVTDILNKKALRLDAMLIDGGFNLSGGERQRIILARSLLRRPSILILDEALSEVDYELEEKILRDVDLYMKGKTLLYVSHGIKSYFKEEFYIGD